MLLEGLGGTLAEECTPLKWGSCRVRTEYAEYLFRDIAGDVGPTLTSRTVGPKVCVTL